MSVGLSRFHTVIRYIRGLFIKSGDLSDPAQSCDESIFSVVLLRGSHPVVPRLCLLFFLAHFPGICMLCMYRADPSDWLESVGFLVD